MHKNPIYSVIIPVFNEEETLSELLNGLILVMDRLNAQYEIILVDDCSIDRSPEIIEKFRTNNKNIKMISLSRNFGQQIAITAGLDYATGDAVIIMDADFQDDPDIITQFIEKWRKGYEVVYAIRQKRKEHFYKRWLFSLYYRILQKLSYIPIPPDAGSFSLIDKKIVNIFKQMKERNRFIPGLRAWAGFKQIGIKIERPLRLHGKPRVSIIKLFKLALDGLFSFSLIPLRLVVYIGLIISFISFLMGLFLIYLKIFTSLPILGWTSTMVTILFLGGIQLICIGIIGEYIGRVYEETKHRPLYVTKKLAGLTENTPC